MTDVEEPWRPLGVDSEKDVAEYDALHDEVPAWMEAGYWGWVKRSITSYSGGSVTRSPSATLNTGLVQGLAQTLRIPMPALGASNTQILIAVSALQLHPDPLQVADYLLAHGGRAPASELELMLERSKSAWKVGERSGKPGLVRRVPLGVQLAADGVMATAARAGVRLAQAWGALYGFAPDPSKAYGLAIKAVEDASIPVVSPKNGGATLGTVLKQIEDQKHWSLPMGREHGDAPSGEVLVSMMRMIWHGQHDRHGGQPSAPGDVSFEEAKIAVSIAVPLVQWFSDGLAAPA